MGQSEYRQLDRALAEGNINDELRMQAKYQNNLPGGYPGFYRFVILETIFEPSKITPQKLDYWEHDLGVDNIKYGVHPPRNSIIAKRVRSSTSVDITTLILYPFFPPALSLPCNPGEHVWVMFEDQKGLKSDLGYWFCRITQPGYVDDVNHTHAPRRDDPSFVVGTKDLYNDSTSPIYEFNNGPIYLEEGERIVDGEGAFVEGDNDFYKNVMTNSEGGRLSTYEPVPRFVKRPGDIVLEGTNNALIVLGRDRTAAAADYNSSSEESDSRGELPILPQTDAQSIGAGQIDLVVGRGQTSETSGIVVQNDLPAEEIGKSNSESTPNEGNPDLLNDRSRITISQKTLVDTNLNLSSFNIEFEQGANQGSAQSQPSITDDTAAAPEGDGAIVIKSDKIRIVARSDIEFMVSGYTRDENGNMVTDENESNWAAVVIKANGDIVMRPATQGFIKLGSDKADKAILCTDFPAVAAAGFVTAPPINTTMAGQFGGTGIPTQGAYASKILVDGPTQ